MKPNIGLSLEEMELEKDLRAGCSYEFGEIYGSGNGLSYSYKKWQHSFFEKV